MRLLTVIVTVIAYHYLSRLVRRLLKKRRIAKLRRFYEPVLIAPGYVPQRYDMVDDIEEGIGQVIHIDTTINMPLVKYPHYPVEVLANFGDLTLVQKKIVAK